MAGPAEIVDYVFGVLAYVLFEGLRSGQTGRSTVGHQNSSG